MNDIVGQGNLTESISLPEMEQLWTVDDVAYYLQLEPETVRSMARRKEIPALKIGRVWRFRKLEIFHALESEKDT